MLWRNRSVLPGSCCQVMGDSSYSWIQAFLCIASVSSWVVSGQTVLLVPFPLMAFGPRRRVSSTHQRLWFCWWLHAAVQQFPRETGTGRVMTSMDVQYTWNCTLLHG